jgi:ABC-type lipoprotein release transport system permease subunit
MSLGATARQIKLMVIRDGYRPVAEGLVLGLWGGVAARMIIRSATDLDVAIFDPWMLMVSPVPVILATLCACYWPAARASRVNPTTALRYE